MQLLLDAVDSKRVLFNSPVANIDLSQTSVRLEDGTELKAKVVVGADGLRSAVARGLNLPPPNFTGQAGFRGLASFDGPAPAKQRTVCQVLAAP